MDDLTLTSGASRNFERVGGAGSGRAESNVSSSYFIANAHNDVYAFYMGKSNLLKKYSDANTGAAAPPLSSFKSASVPRTFFKLLDAGLGAIYAKFTSYTII